MILPTDLTNLFAWYRGESGLYDATSGGSPADGAAIAAVRQAAGVN